MKRSFRAIAALAAGGVLASLGLSTASTAQQAASIANPQVSIAEFSPETIGPLLTELGLVWQVQTPETGQSYIAASYAGLINFILAPTACRGANGAECVGLNMVAIFEGSANPQTVRAFNYRYAFASAGIDPSGAAYLSRYDLSDYGIARGNLATSVQVFVNQVAMFAAELDTSERTVSLEGYADDLASSALNREVRETLSGSEIHAANAIERHQFGLEEGAAAVRRFILDENAPRNKIENVTRD